MKNARWNNMSKLTVVNIILVICSFILTVLLPGCKRNDSEPAKDIVLKKRLDAYTEVQYGNMPLIISVPHGGTNDDASILDRTCPGITTATDIRTIELLIAIDSVCKTDYKVQPYFVASYLKRIKIDQNRDIPEATCGNAALTGYWSNYHLSIDTFISKIRLKYPMALFIDLHGHGHTKQRLELGYLVSSSELQNPVSINTVSTSVYNLTRINTTLNTLQLLTGANAFGTLMANKNFPSVPSQQDAAPAAGDPYFDGGYNTARYCSALYPSVFGWQVETNFTGVRDNTVNRSAFAKAFVQSLMQFYTANTGMQPSSFGK